MKIIISFASLFALISIFSACTASGDKHVEFLQCLSLHSPNSDPISNLTHSPANSSYSPLLNFTIQNLRFSSPDSPKPYLIITPTQASHVQAAVVCSRAHGLQIRTRSGGHDFEGLSYTSDVPFIIIDLVNFSSISVDAENRVAWVESGATLGQLYYAISQKSGNLGFPAGNCPTVGVGGYLSGGGSGLLQRKYGLAADNVIDAHLVDANGKVLDRKAMGEGLFWAIRGGGGGSFGIVLAWKVKLVPVPSTVTVFSLSRAWDQNATKLVHQWQYIADKLDENLFLDVLLSTGRTTAGVSFFSLFLGKADELLTIMQKAFPALGLAKADCVEMSWIESQVTAASSLQNRKQIQQVLLPRPLATMSFKGRMDFVKEPLSQAALEGIREKLTNKPIQGAGVFLIPYGGKMSQISPSETPFPYRAGTLFHVGYIVAWREQGSIETARRHLNWSKDVYDYLGPFVSKSPRGAYVNYRDLDIGTNEARGEGSGYDRARAWGVRYFGSGNFDRLVRVKTKVDRYDLFRHEQSIPSLSRWK